MQLYKSASYQQDVISEIKNQSEVFFYGKGFNDFSINDNIDDIINKAPFNPDAIIQGHSWLSDDSASQIERYPQISLKKINIPKIIILNKEYVNLNNKIDYIKSNKFNLGFSHHHDVENFSKMSNTKFYFWPFAYDDNIFSDNIEDKTVDFGFSGILQNLNKDTDQSDIRIKIMKKIFFTFYDVPLIKKKSYRSTEIFWNSIPRTSFGRYLSILLKKRRYLSHNEYAKKIKSSKIYLNTLSPFGLISPRFFECMSSRALVFCEESELYSNVFDKNLFVTFKKDLSDFDEKLNHYLINQNERESIINRAEIEVKKNHTWKIRISFLLKKIKEII